MLKAIGGTVPVAATSSAASADSPLHYRTIAKLSGLIKSGNLSPVELTRHTLRRIETLALETSTPVTVDSKA
jgi:Asp-tRNA(Asn)/Glu-tRNA(Gln) amidotransferase A subunit family amidase